MKQKKRFNSPDLLFTEQKINRFIRGLEHCNWQNIASLRKVNGQCGDKALHTIKFLSNFTEKQISGCDWLNDPTKAMKQLTRNIAFLGEDLFSVIIYRAVRCMNILLSIKRNCVTSFVHDQL